MPQARRRRTLQNMSITTETELVPIPELAASIGLEPDEVLMYGQHAAKIELSALDRLRDEPDGKLICVTAMTPTKAGRGQDDDRDLAGRGARPRSASARCSACASRRSGRCSGSRAAAPAADARRSSPMEQINLHFTGDIHAIGAANNLLAAMVDVAPPARQRARPRPALDHLAALPRHGRPRAAPGRGRPRRPRERLSARDRLRHHRRLGGDGDRRRLARPRRPARAARRDHRRLDLRGRAGDRRAARRRRARWRCSSRTRSSRTSCRRSRASRRSSTAGRSRTSPTATTRSSPTGSASSSRDYVVTESGFGADMGFEKFVDIVCRARRLRAERRRPRRDRRRR